MSGPSSRGPSEFARKRDFSRVARVGATAQKALAAPVDALVQAAHGVLATVTAVEISPDLRHATVSLSVLGDEALAQACLATVRAQGSALQQRLARSLRTRQTPVLRFVLDASGARADRIHRLLGEPPTADT
jgi:ribosome-binding factor A